MSNTLGLPMIPTGEILQPSSRFPVTLQDETTPPPTGYFFSTDEKAVRFKAVEHPNMIGKVELPLELSMQGVFRLENPSSFDRPADDFRIVLPDREVAPSPDEQCTVMPYILYNGIVSLALRVVELEDSDMFNHDSFWLNILEPGMSQPFSGVTDAYLQVILNRSDRPAEEVVERYLALKEKAGNVLQRLFNTHIATT